MTDSELRDELVTLLLAGHETTATSVAWAIERLVRHPEKLRRLHGRDRRSGEGGSEEYMTAVVNETLRVRPVVPIVARMLAEELEVGGYRLPAGTRVVPSIYLTNRNPRVLRAARPSSARSASSTARRRPSPGSPSAGGIRRCIGASFALLEMKLILRTMLSELEPSLPARGRRWRQRRVEPPAGDHAGAGRGRTRGVEQKGASSGR